MLEQVLEIEQGNIKALCRKLQILTRQGQVNKAENLVKSIKSRFTDFARVKPEDAELLQGTLKEAERELLKQNKKQQDFSKKVFANTVYSDKPDV